MDILYFSFNVTDLFSDFLNYPYSQSSEFSAKATMSLLFNYLLIHKIRAVFHLTGYERIRPTAEEKCSGNTLGREDNCLLQLHATSL